MSKPLWNVLILLSGILAFWRIAVASFGYWDQARYQIEISPEVLKWEIISKGSKYALEGTFRYSYQGKVFICKTLLSKPYYLNQRSAEKEIQKISGMKWCGWIDPHHPETATLEKNIPYREIFYATILFGIFLYFLYMKFHLELFLKKND